jgi:hypothetical protein
VRAANADLLTEMLPQPDLDYLVAVQLLSLDSKPDRLENWGYSVPVELMLHNPSEEYALLYRFAKLLDQHPVRVSIPVVAGFGRAVRVAASLRFAVKLEIGQIEGIVVDELLQALDLYLHQSKLTQPIEFFHSTLEAFYYQQPTELWDIQWENPARVLTLPMIVWSPWPDARGSGCRIDHRSDRLCRRSQTDSLATRGECLNCEYFDYCGSYFKWPHKYYDCADVRVVFKTIEDAAMELGRDVERFSHSRMEAPR